MDSVIRLLHLRLPTFVTLDLVMRSHVSHTMCIEGSFSNYAAFIFTAGQPTKNHITLIYICLLIGNKNSLAGE